MSRAVGRGSLNLPKFECQSLDIGRESLAIPKFDRASGVQIFATVCPDFCDPFLSCPDYGDHFKTFATNFSQIQATATHSATNF